MSATLRFKFICNKNKLSYLSSPVINSLGGKTRFADAIELNLC